MPLKDYRCEACASVEELYQRHWDDPAPSCPGCGGPRAEIPSRFGVVFTGPLTTRYNDPKRENAHQEGYWAYRKRSSVSGQPEPEFLDTWDKVREFNKAEGLSAPGEIPTNSTISADGKRIVSNGMPGQWQAYDPNLIPSRVWEMDTKLTSLKGNTPAPQASGEPCSGRVVDAGLMDKFAAEAGKA